MQEHIKVTNHPNLVREKKSKAVLNVDALALNKYKEERKRIKNLNNVVKENIELKNEINEIKMMLQQLLGQKSK